MASLKTELNDVGVGHPALDIQSYQNIQVMNVRVDVSKLEMHLTTICKYTATYAN